MPLSLRHYTPNFTEFPLDPGLKLVKISKNKLNKIVIKIHNICCSFTFTQTFAQGTQIVDICCLNVSQPSKMMTLY